MNREAFEGSVAAHRRALHAHCYRMLGSLADADDALQDALLGAWRGRETFAGRASVRAWLYAIATNACLAIIEKRASRARSMPDAVRAASTGVEVAALELEPIWLEPYPTHELVERREAIELAFVAALQYLPPNQRAALVLCDVLDFAAAEAAEALGTSIATITSALQRARVTIAARVPARSQVEELASLGDAGQRSLAGAFVEAWGRADAAALVALLARDVRFTMPPIPTWFAGREAVGRFFAERVFAAPWRLVEIAGGANGQLAFACYQGPAYGLGALNVVTVGDGTIAALTGFLDPAVHRRFSLPDR